MNAVRLPVEVAVWKREGQPYFDRLARVVAAANAEGLVAVLASFIPMAAILMPAGLFHR